MNQFVYGIQPEVVRQNTPVVDEDSDEIDLEYIIRERPPVKEVRQFFREALGQIKSIEERLFG